MICTQENPRKVDLHLDFKAAYWVLPPIERKKNLDLSNKENLDMHLRNS